MSEPGDIHLADLNEELRRRVMVASSSRFSRAAGRVVVIPEVFGVPDEVPFPWRVEHDDTVYAVDLLRTMPVERLLEQTGQASHSAIARIRRAIRLIT